MAKLLVVDDDEGTLAWMTAALEDAGHEVRAMLSGRDGLEALRSWTPDLIIADILMPEMSGLVFNRLIQSYHQIPLMFISIAKKQAESILCGAIGYVQKPVTADEAFGQLLGEGAKPGGEVQRVLVSRAVVHPLRIEGAVPDQRAVAADDEGIVARSPG